MSRSVRMLLKSRQTLDGQEDRTRQTLDARLEQTETGWTLSWREPPQAGMGETEAVLTLTQGEAVLTRRGETSVKMTFRRGLRVPVVYETPHGALTMELETRALRWSVDGTAGRVELLYDLYLGGGAPSANLLTVAFKEL